MDREGSSIRFNVARNLTNGANSLWVDGYIVNPNPRGGKDVYITGAFYTGSGFQAKINQAHGVPRPTPTR
jgi:hypothetical protein